MAIFKKIIFGLNVVGPQGVNAENEFTVGQLAGGSTGELAVVYEDQPAIQLGTRIFTPVGTLYKGPDGEYWPLEEIPAIPDDAIAEGKNYILGLDEDAEVAWIKFPELPDDYDEKNYVLALNDDGVMVWVDHATIAPQYCFCTVKTETAGDEADVVIYINNTDLGISGAYPFIAKVGDEIGVAYNGAKDYEPEVLDAPIPAGITGEGTAFVGVIEGAGGNFQFRFKTKAEEQE